MADGAFTCPHCGDPLDAGAGPEPQELTCRHCGGLIAIPAVEGAVQTAGDPAPPLPREDELSSVRIRQLAGARRAAYRARSSCVVATLVCVVAVVQLGWTAVRVVRVTGGGVRPIVYGLVALLAAWGAAYFFRKAMAFDREAKQSALPEATGEPDFAALSDGSQRWKDLEEIR